MTARRAATAGLVAMAFLALVLPALINRHPILYSDSIGYFRSGTTLLRAAAAQFGMSSGGDTVGADPSRSVYYGVFITAVEAAAGAWGVVLAQAALTLAVLLLALRRFAVPALPAATVALVLSLATGLSIFASTLMPDLYAGFMILAAALLIAFWGRMPHWERGFWLACAEYAMLIHKGHILMLALLLALAGAAALGRGRARANWPPFAALGGAVVLAGLAHAGVAAMVSHKTGRPFTGPPFLLARVVGDGTAKLYLDAECGRRRLVLCAYKDRLPRTENQFLWAMQPDIGLYARAGAEERRRIDAEADTVVIGAVTGHPLVQARATLGNMARMTMLVGVTRYGLPMPELGESGTCCAPLLRDYRSSAIARGIVPLAAISRWMLAVYLASLVVLGGLAIWSGRYRRLHGDCAAAVALIVVGVAVNAAVFGAISSDADRYQGRVAWLIPFAVLAAFRPQVGAIAAALRAPRARS